MSATHTRPILAALTAFTMVALVFISGSPPAAAAPAPVQPAPANTVTADRLPTVQVDGVVWSQAVVGNTVYAGGKFGNARPAGAAPGTSLTVRNNLLAYDITTGNLVTWFVPDLNGQVLSVAASPDGSRIYVAGDFTTANGQARRRVAAYSTATGALVTAFNPPGPNSQARAVIATNDTVYVGGGFIGVGNGQLRNNLAAFAASTGALLPWNPSTSGTAADPTPTVWALAISDNGLAVFAGGAFQNVGGQPAYGLAKIDAVTGALNPTWQAAATVQNAGKDAGITSLRVQGDFVYGTTYHFGDGGNLEGTFKAPVGTGIVEWVTDCHGDNYSSFMANGVVYTASHAHYCGNMGGGFPQYSTWKFQHAQAWNDTVTGDILNDVHGYPNWHGVKPGPAMINWLPDLGIGSFTGQYQAGWSVTGNNDYIVYGGEFPTVNNTGQQGLVRFAKKPIAPAKEGPRFVDNAIVPTLVPASTTALRVSWPSGYDKDSYQLTYQLVRNGAFGSPRYTTTKSSNWWTLPTMGFVDTGLTPGATYNYQLVVRDADGNTVYGAAVPVTMPSTFPAATAYANTVRANGARIYWPLNETAGTTVTDRAAVPGSAPGIGVTDGRADTGVSWGKPGAIPGDAAASLGDNDWSRVYAGNCAVLGGCNWSTETAPDTFSVQVWFRTNSNRGGRLIGFSDLQNGTSGHRDRHLYLTDAGKLVFGVKAPNNSLRTVTSGQTYLDNQWRLATATMGPGGMALYVNATLVGADPSTTEGEPYLGYWRLGGDYLNGWPARPTSRNFNGFVDEVAVYPTALTPAQILAQYNSRTGTPATNQPPTAAFTSSTAGLSATVNASGSSDSDGTITSYAWTFGDGSTGTGVTTSHPYAAAGTYNVALTVTDDDAAAATQTQPVTVSVPPAGQLAADAFDRTITGGWGSADVGGAWTLGTAASNFAVGGGSGTISMAAGSGPSAYLNSVSGRDVELRTRLSFNKPGSGGGIYASGVIRRNGTSDYRAKIRVSATDTTLYLVRAVNGAETVLTSQVVPGLVMGAGETVELRFQAVGAGTSDLRARVWKGGAAEPAGWTATTTDATAALQNPGAAGLLLYLSGSATNAPVVVSVPDLTLQQLP